MAEKDVKRAGILDYQISNATPFEDDPQTTIIGTRLANRPRNPVSDWNHLEVHNRNTGKQAHA